MNASTCLSILLGLALARPATACSAFCLAGKNRVVVGKSYDWYFGHGHGMLYVNPRGIDRETLILSDAPNPARWTSRFGSVTMTQFGRGTPISGINEGGLVIEVLELGETGWGARRQDVPYVNEAQWVQYQLDRFGTVAEVLAHIDDLRIEQAFIGVHYFLADEGGATATVEFREGAPVIHAGDTLPIPVLTNTFYDDAMAYTKAHPEYPPESMLRRSSEVRFVRARAFTDLVPITPDAELPAMAWNILDAVRTNGTAPGSYLGPSQWNIVYDVTDRTIAFRTRGHGGVKRVALAALDLSEGAAEMILDMKGPVVGDVSPHLRPYTAAANEALLRKNTWLFAATAKSDVVERAVEYGRTCEIKIIGR